MSGLPPQVLQHFQQPQNVGEIEGATHRAQVENPVCGDLLELSLLVAGGHIQQARFRAQGCVATVAAGSALTSLIAGMEFADAQGFDRARLVDELGGLTPHSMHASHLACDALRAALNSGPNGE